MGLFAVLLINGGLLVAAERRYASAGADVAKWRRVIAVSGASVVLWLVILWIGEWLTVAA